MPFPVYMAMIFNSAPEFDRQETTHSKLGLPRPGLQQGSKILTNIGCRSFHYCSAKHGQAHLNYCTEAEPHSCYFSMQPIPLMVGNSPRKDALNFAYGCSKLAVLILVGQLATPYSNAAV